MNTRFEDDYDQETRDLLARLADEGRTEDREAILTLLRFKADEIGQIDLQTKAKITDVLQKLAHETADADIDHRVRKFAVNLKDAPAKKAANATKKPADHLLDLAIILMDGHPQSKGLFVPHHPDSDGSLVPEILLPAIIEAEKKLRLSEENIITALQAMGVVYNEPDLLDPKYNVYDAWGVYTKSKNTGGYRNAVKFSLTDLGLATVDFLVADGRMALQATYAAHQQAMVKDLQTELQGTSFDASAADAAAIEAGVLSKQKPAPRRRGRPLPAGKRALS